jgi:hypothetical protein
VCTTEPSWMFTLSPSSIQSLSPRIVTFHQTLAL